MKPRRKTARKFKLYHYLEFEHLVTQTPMFYNVGRDATGLNHLRTPEELWP
jgi:hypothetical protein